jgi:hypothetical protein
MTRAAARKSGRETMPLAEKLPERATPLYEELSRRVQWHSGSVDFLMYNVGIVVALFSSGAAAVVATKIPLLGSALAALSAFLIAVTRILKFGSRWGTQLSRRAKYSAMIYDLNAVAYLDEELQNKRIDEIYVRLAKVRREEGNVPGITDEAG